MILPILFNRKYGLMENFNGAVNILENTED